MRHAYTVIVEGGTTVANRWKYVVVASGAKEAAMKALRRTRGDWDSKKWVRPAMRVTLVQEIEGSVVS